MHIETTYDLTSQVCDLPSSVWRLVLVAVRKIAKRGYWLRHVCPSLCPSVSLHGTTRLLRDGFSRNL